MALNTRRPVPVPVSKPQEARKPRPDELSDDAFERVMSKASDYRPDAVAEAVTPPSKLKGVRMGNKRQITLTIFDDQIDAVEVMARKMGMTRTSYISYAIAQQLRRDES